MLRSPRLVQRICEIAKAKKQIESTAVKQSVLPAVDHTTVEAAVEYVAQFQWPARYIQHIVESTCASLRSLDHTTASSNQTSKHAIESFCNHLTGTQLPVVPTSALTAQCYNDLVLSIVEYQGLHFTGRQLVKQMLDNQIPLSLPVEQSLPTLYSEDHAALLTTIDRARKAGYKPSKRLYREAVKLCIGGKWTNCSEASNMKRLVQQLGKDWGEEEGKALLYSSAFQTARSVPEVEAIVADMLESGLKADKEVSHHLLDACKRAVDIDSPSKLPAGVRVLIDHLVPRGIPVSLESFEGLLTECFKRKNLSATVHVFRCMTRTYRIAPSRQAYRCLTSLISMNAHSTVLRRKLVIQAFQILQDTTATYGSIPPPWVYTDMAVPLLELFGMKGYQQLYAFSEAAAAMAHNSTYLSVGPEEVWLTKVYDTLLYVAYKDHVRRRYQDLGISLYHEMLNKGIEPDEQTFCHLLRCIREQDFVYVLSQMEKRDLLPMLHRKAIASALKAMYSKRYHRKLYYRKLLETAVDALMRTLYHASPQYCITQLST